MKSIHIILCLFLLSAATGKLRAQAQDMLILQNEAEAAEFQKYTAEVNLLSTAKIRTAAEIRYEAGREIHLSEGFFAEFGSEFSAVIVRPEDVQPAARMLPPEEATFKAYPNPFRENITLEFEGEHPGTAVLLDAQGKRILEFALNPARMTVIRTDRLPAGIYFVRVEGYPARKLVK